MLFDHTKKIHPDPFDAVVRGFKRFEVRQFDEPWASGETLLLREWNPADYEAWCKAASVSAYPSRDEKNGHPDQEAMDIRAEANHRAFTGQSYACRVTYIVKPGSYGLPTNMIVFGIEPLTALEAQQ